MSRVWKIADPTRFMYLQSADTWLMKRANCFNKSPSTNACKPLEINWRSFHESYEYVKMVKFIEWLNLSFCLPAIQQSFATFMGTWTLTFTRAVSFTAAVTLVIGSFTWSDSVAKREMKIYFKVDDKHLRNNLARNFLGRFDFEYEVIQPRSLILLKSKLSL